MGGISLVDGGLADVRRKEVGEAGGRKRLIFLEDVDDGVIVDLKGFFGLVVVDDQ